MSAPNQFSKPLPTGEGEPFSLRELMRRALWTFAPATQAAGVALEADSAEGIPLLVRGHPHLLRNALLDALASLDFSDVDPSGPGRVLLRCGWEDGRAFVHIEGPAREASAATLEIFVPLCRVEELNPEERARLGEEMIDRWMSDQIVPRLREKVPGILRTRVRTEAEVLDSSLSSGDHAEAYEIAHRFKGWTGSYRFAEIYETLSVLCDLLDPAEEEPDRDLLQEAAAQLREVIALIPDRYLSEEGARER